MKHLVEHSEFRKNQKFKVGDWVWVRLSIYRYSDSGPEYNKRPGKIVDIYTKNNENENTWYQTIQYIEGEDRWHKYNTINNVMELMTEEEIEDFEIKLQAKKFNL